MLEIVGGGVNARRGQGKSEGAGLRDPWVKMKGTAATVTRLGAAGIRKLGPSPTEWIIDGSRVSSGLTDTPKAQLFRQGRRGDAHDELGSTGIFAPGPLFHRLSRLRLTCIAGPPVIHVLLL